MKTIKNLLLSILFGLTVIASSEAMQPKGEESITSPVPVASPQAGNDQPYGRQPLIMNLTQIIVMFLETGPEQTETNGQQLADSIRSIVAFFFHRGLVPTGEADAKLRNLYRTLEQGGNGLQEMIEVGILYVPKQQLAALIQRYVKMAMDEGFELTEQKRTELDNILRALTDSTL